jgi:ribosomal protein S18 acetylase RimI-like enzyme
MLAMSADACHFRYGNAGALTMRIGLREATMADADALIGLFDIASFGFVEHVFRYLSDPGADIAHVLRARLADPASHLHVGKARLAEIDGVVVGLLSGEVVVDPPVSLDSDFPAILRPIMELEHLAPGTFNVGFLAVLPEAQGQGVARALLEDAAGRAPAKGMSLSVHDQNAGARRLYESFGFREAARRPIVKAGWKTAARDWVLMVRPGGSDPAVG